MDAIKLLTAQHRALENVLKKALQANGAEQYALFKQGADELSVHIASEEQIFYPAVKAKRTRDILLESLEEHLSLKRLIADLLTLKPADDTFQPKLKVLSEQAEHHHKEEEEHLFPKVTKLLDDKELDDLGSEMQALQLALIKHGDPRKSAADETAEAQPL
ncbi:hemerythrin domain-containing protein [Undibacterium sp. TJN25]|uniref:hemerythrin domain-containing protein n=1 Tax=Undibacterium sp. TJN25 TaxID=3413056 RepID=UPI003BF41F98